LQGWNVIGNVAGEVHTPNRNIPLGVALAVLLVTLNYVWPLTFTIPMSPPPSPADDPGAAGARWGTGYFVGLAARAAPELGVWAGVAAVLSCLSNFIPVLATSARALQAAAKIGMVPSRVASEWLESEDPKRGVPIPATFSILFVVLGLMVLSFETLVTTQILLALVGLCLQFAAFIRLKYTAPEASRPYAVPYGKVGAWVLAAPFFFLAALIAYSNISGSLQNWVSSIAVATSTVGLYALGDLWWVKGGHFDKERVDRVLQEAQEGGEEGTTELLPFLSK
jgi:amino acid transporter